MDGLPDLLELSKIDLRLDGLRGELAEIPAKRAEFERRRVESEERLVASREAVTEAEQEQRRNEGEARDQEAQLSKLESQQHQVKSNEAYTALLAEMDQARAAISEAETRILEAMESIEAARAVLGDAESQVENIKGHIADEEKACDAREQELAGAITTLGGERDGVVARIDEPLAKRYEKVAGRRSPAVAIVAKETCQGCRVGIPPQAVIQILQGSEIVACGTCQRILIHEDLVPKEAG